MQRSTGLFLLAVGVLFLLLFAIGMINALTDKQGNDGLMLLWIVLGIFGGLISFAAVGLMRGARPIGETPKPVEGRVGNYLADTFEARQHNGRHFEVFYRTPVKGKDARPSLLTVRLPVKAPTTLQFNDENWFDKLCKRFGIAREHQTGEAIFDDSVYIRGPSHDFAEEYLKDPQKREAILRLRRLGFQEVRLTGTHVEAEWKVFDPKTDDRPDLPEDAVDQLRVLAQEVPANDPEGCSPTESHQGTLLVLWAVAISFAFLFVAVFVYMPVHESALIFAGLAVFVVAYPVFGWVAAHSLRGMSTSHDRWAKLMSVGVLLLGLGSGGLVAAINGLADESQPEGRSLVITDKRISTGKRNSKTYYASVPAWDDRGGMVEFRVSSSEYSSIITGKSKLDLTTHRGRLGIEWLKSKRVIK